MRHAERTLLMLFIFTFLTLSNNTWAQENSSSGDGSPSMINKIRSLELDSLKNGVWVHYEQGQKDRAKRLGHLVYDALSFFEDSLGIDQNMRVALLDSVTWTRVRSAPYGIPGIRGKNPPVAIMPADAKGRAYRMYIQ